MEKEIKTKGVNAINLQLNKRTKNWVWLVNPCPAEPKNLLFRNQSRSSTQLASDEAIWSGSALLSVQP